MASFTTHDVVNPWAKLSCSWFAVASTEPVLAFQPTHTPLSYTYIACLSRCKQSLRFMSSITRPRHIFADGAKGTKLDANEIAGAYDSLCERAYASPVGSER